MYELANVDNETAGLMIKDAFNEGFKVIRFWAFEPLSKYRLEDICIKVNNYGMKIIPVLADPWGYLQSYKINQSWYKSDFRTTYFKHITEIAGYLKNRKEILMWELINEPSTGSFEDIHFFAKSASECIKSIDSNHLVSIGTIGGIGDKFGGFFSRFSESNFEKLYSLKSLDAVSLHDYSFNSTLFERLDILNRFKGNQGISKFTGKLNDIFDYFPTKIDKWSLNKFGRTYDFPLTFRNVWRSFNEKNITAARNLNKPVYIGETGIKKSLGVMRKKVLELELKKHFNDGVCGVLLWSFESQGRSLDGHDYGFDLNDEFRLIIKKINSQINN